MAEDPGLGDQTVSDPTRPIAPPIAPQAATGRSRGGWPSDRPIAVGRPTPDFESKAITPEYRTTPYRPDTIVDGWSTSHFTVRGASVRGYSHRYRGSPRQDDFAIVVRQDPAPLLIVAVADGVSESKQSHIGASTAVRYATQWLSTSIHDSVAETDWKALAQSTAWAIIEQCAALLSTEAVDAAQAEALASTTLVCAVIEPSGEGHATAHTVGIGDSGAWILSGGAFHKLEGGKEEGGGGITSSAVAGLPRVPTEVQPTVIDIGPGDVFLLGSDGFGDPLGGGDGEVGRLFADTLQDRVPPIHEFAHVLDFSRETFDDDRTLVAVWPRIPPA